MSQRHGVNYTLFAIGTDALLTLLSLALAEMVRVVWPWGWVLRPGEIIPQFLWPAVIIIWQVTFLAVSVYDPRRTLKAVDELQGVITGTFFAGLALAGFLYLVHYDMSRWFYVLFLAINLTLLIGRRVVTRAVARLWSGRAKARRVLVVGAGEVGQQVADMVAANDWAGLAFVGYLDDDPGKQQCGLPVLGTLDDAERLVREHDIDEVVIALPRRAWERLNQLAVTLHTLPVQVRVVPDYFSLALYRAEVSDFAGLPMIDLRAPALNDYQRLVKRALDVTLGGVAFVLALPLMAVIAVAVKLSSPGPVLFKQQRVGENGRLFAMLKFRSMVHGADRLERSLASENEKGELVLKRPDDPRVTPLGRFLRRTSLDELPQLWNVLRGDMSLVGPRPELPWLVERYQPWQRKRFAVPQGITGWWQVNGRSDKEMHLHTEDDLYYVQHYSLWLDLTILLRTVLVVLKGRGAY